MEGPYPERNYNVKHPRHASRHPAILQAVSNGRISRNFLRVSSEFATFHRGNHLVRLEYRYVVRVGFSGFLICVANLVVISVFREFEIHRFRYSDGPSYDESPTHKFEVARVFV
ncbi:hypothetical protein GE061_006425 [Apolygus lucorum]|uniref:Uncharacterized protein n=1 Tax=Apolygus lucorum TaxID=248454 RepID=A0A6A4J868_APOLU|nr:hypothetical protein GE061_006425 [Apolygus lucorum]